MVVSITYITSGYSLVYNEFFIPLIFTYYTFLCQLDGSTSLI